MRASHLFRYVAAITVVVSPVGAATAQGVTAASEAATACTNLTESPSTAPDSTGTAARAAQSDTAHPAIRILVSASANELTFVGSPKVCVRLTGAASLDSVHVLARRNLPSPVVSGTTYRNVYVALEILGRLNADCITRRITGAPVDSTEHCAGVDVRTGGATRGPP
jgi:hypothetical protein